MFAKHRNPIALPSIPQPDGPASLKALKSLLRHGSLLDALSVFHAEMGDAFLLQLPGLKTAMLVGPEANRFILVSHRDKFRWRVEGDPVTILLREGILVTDGETHDTLRRLMNPALHRRVLDYHVDTISQCTDEIIDRWQQASTIDMLVEMRKITLLSLTRTLFRTDIAPELDRLWQPVVKSIEYISPGLWLLWRNIPRRGYDKHIRLLNDYLYRIIAERRALKIYEDTSDLLGLLIASGMDDNLIRDQLLTMLIAGHDTSTALLAWALYLLAKHPDAMGHAQAEVDHALSLEIPALDKLSQLLYLGQIIDETLRLYPPIHLGSRLVAEDVEFNGMYLPAGLRVMYSIYLTQRHPRYWHAPDKFQPDRFNPENKRNILPYTYLPFGGGARNCIGTAFALVEAKVILARILQKYNLLSSQQRVGIRMAATLEPKPGVTLHVRRRPST